MEPPVQSRRHLAAQGLLVIAGLVGADLIARALGLEPAIGVFCLATLATLVVSSQLGWQQALLGAVGLAVLSIPAALAQGDPLLATALMAITGLGLGVSARWQLQPVYWLMVVSLCLLVVEPQLAAATSGEELIRLSGGLLLSCSLPLLAQTVLLPQTQARRLQRMPVQHSWRRCMAYGLLLACTSLVTTPFALQHHWHINGLWLICTPFLVVKPFVRDGWKVALHRTLGTLAGVVLVMGLGIVVPPAMPLEIPALLMATLTGLIAAKRGHPALMLMALTATIVLFNSNSINLIAVADQRIQATALGLVIALSVMGLAQPIEQRFAHRPSQP